MIKQLNWWLIDVVVSYNLLRLSENQVDKEKKVSSKTTIKFPYSNYAKVYEVRFLPSLGTNLP